MAEKPTTPQPERLGKYTLDKRIAAGGMAEVFVATEDNGRRVVIKRMLPALLVDKQFARMFLDEAKLVVQLNHPAIAQIYDFGQDKGVLYLAMEYVDGTNLRLIVKDHAKRQAAIPLEYCARLVAQAAVALGYAHRAKGIDGKALTIIHRDVSPQNILLGQAGDVKLIDFGVAKASSATQQTAAGMIKGKFAYMSPEQLRGNPLDGRSDIYGLGLVLYELLAAERAIPGSSEAEIAQNALQLKYPPIEVKRPDVPAALKAIVQRALAKDRDKRYETAEQMAGELEAFIAARMPKLSNADVAKILPASALTAPTAANKESGSNHNPVAFWEAAPNVPTMKETLPGLPDDATLRGGGGPRPVVNASPRLPMPAYENVAKTVINPPGLVPKNAAMARGKEPGPFIARSEFKAIEPTLPDELTHPPQSRLKWFLIATTVGFVVAAAAWKLMDVAPGSAAEVPVAARPPPTVVELPNPEPVAPPPAPEPAKPAEPKAAPVAEMAKLTLTATIPAKVALDGKPLGKTPVELVVGVGAHTAAFEDLGGSGAKQVKKFEVTANDTHTEEWKPEKGKVVVRATPWAEVFLNGKSLGQTPLEPMSMYAGRYTLTFTNSETKKQEDKVIEVKANADTMVKVDLR